MVNEICVADSFENPRQGLFPMVTIPFRGVGSTLRWIIGQFYGCHVSTCKYICCILVHDVSFYPMLQATCDFWWFTAGFSIPFLECQHIFRVSAPWKQAYLDDVPFGTPDFQARYCYTILACACAFHWETDPAYPMTGSELHWAQVAGLLWSSGWMRWPFQWARSGSWSAGRTLRAEGRPWGVSWWISFAADRSMRTFQAWKKTEKNEHIWTICEHN